MDGAMIAALKKKKSQGLAVEGDHQDMGHDSGHADDKQKDLHGLVASLNHSEKSQLKSILNSDSQNTQQIAKGGPSSEETAHVQSAMSDENKRTDMSQTEQNDAGDGHDSDELAKSMLDSSHLRGTASTSAPRNLGERMKQGLAAKLKGKGKI